RAPPSRRSEEPWPRTGPGQRNLLRAATTVVADGDRAGESAPAQRFERYGDGTGLSCSHARIAVVRLGKRARARDRDASDAEYRAPYIRQSHSLRWRRASVGEVMAGKVQSGWNELHDRPRPAQTCRLGTAG